MIVIGYPLWRTLESRVCGSRDILFNSFVLNTRDFLPPGLFSSANAVSKDPGCAGKGSTFLRRSLTPSKCSPSAAVAIGQRNHPCPGKCALPMISTSEPLTKAFRLPIPCLEEPVDLQSDFR